MWHRRVCSELDIYYGFGPDPLNGIASNPRTNSYSQIAWLSGPSDGIQPNGSAARRVAVTAQFADATSQNDVCVRDNDMRELLREAAFLLSSHRCRCDNRLT